MQGKLVVSGDIGGTNTRLIFARQINHASEIIAQKNFQNVNYKSFEQLLQEFISDFVEPDSIDAACFAVAGPVMDGVVSLTNINWEISETVIRSEFKIPSVKVLNDFAAIAYALSGLDSEQLITLQTGSMPDDGEAVIVGAGTGLGCCHVINIDGEIYVKSSEAGHSHFSPTDKMELQLLEWLWDRQNMVSVEHLVSGRGLNSIYQFLKLNTSEKEDSEVAKKMQLNNPAAVITENADNDVLCNETIRMFLRLYGSAISDIVLHYLPISRVYIAGGIAAKISRHMQSGLFIESFNSDGKMKDLLKKIQVDLILDELIGLKGALAAACSLDN